MQGAARDQPACSVTDLENPTLDLVAAALAGDEAVELSAYPYATSAPLHLLRHPKFATATPVLRKDLSPGAGLAAVVGSRPAFLVDPFREIAVYRHVLPDWLGSPVFFGALVDADEDRYWLFLEQVGGVELWQIGELDVWSSVARWLGSMHAARLHVTAPRSVRDRLVSYDRAYYGRWPERARAFAPSAAARRGLDRVLRRHDELVDRLLSLPQTFIHGELYPSNVLVAHGGDAPTRVATIDWETAAVGPPLVDLAALAEGWDEPQRLTLIESYRSTAAAAGVSGNAGSLTDAALDECRLHLCLRWLGWAQGWSPPREHERDWLALALRLTEQVGL